MTVRLIISEEWSQEYPGAAAGVMALFGAANPAQRPELEKEKEAVQNDIRERFGHREAIKSLIHVQAYTDYYKRFKKTYPVIHQVESIALKNKSIPQVTALVEAMFMAELKNMLLTAGHDVETLEGPVRLGVATGQEGYVRLNGQEQQLKAGDMFMSDDEGVISSVVYGPDARTQITAATTQALFAVYAPPGVGPEAVEAHLRDIEHYVRLVSPEARRELWEVHLAG